MGTIPIKLGEKTDEVNAVMISEVIREEITQVTTKAVVEAIKEMKEVITETLTEVIKEMISKAVIEAITIAYSKTNNMLSETTEWNPIKLGEKSKKADEPRHKITQSEKAPEESKDKDNEGWIEVVRKKKHRTIKTLPAQKVTNPFLDEQYKILKAQRKCFRCLKTCHILSACTNVKRCLKCNEPGHTFSRCNEQPPPHNGQRRLLNEQRWQQPQRPLWANPQ